MSSDFSHYSKTRVGQSFWIILVINSLNEYHHHLKTILKALSWLHIRTWALGGGTGARSGVQGGLQFLLNEANYIIGKGKHSVYTVQLHFVWTNLISGTAPSQFLVQQRQALMCSHRPQFNGNDWLGVCSFHPTMTHKRTNVPFWPILPVQSQGKYQKKENSPRRTANQLFKCIILNCIAILFSCDTNIELLQVL